MAQKRIGVCATILVFSLAVLPGQVCPLLIGFVPAGDESNNDGATASIGSPAPGDATDPGSTASLTVIQGPTGPAGPQGPTGSQGPAGQNAVIATGLGLKNTGGVLSIDTSSLDQVLWKLNGNAGTSAGNNILGTTDNKSLEIHSNGQNVLRINPDRTARFELGGSQFIDIGLVTGAPLDKLITLSSGAYMTPQGNWLAVSDRNLKEHFQAADVRDVLSRVVTMPVSTWNYIGTDTAVRHMGPTAQDFYARFGLGGDDQHICPLDTSGVALAAIQGLHDLIRQRDRELSEHKQRIDDLESRLRDVEAKLGSR